MHLLIDGYNLMHFLGMVPLHGRPAAFAAARAEFLHWFAAKSKRHSADFTLVFDAKQRVAHADSFQRVAHLEVWYSAGETADDWIEGLLDRRKSIPYTVVSNDTRLQKSARAHSRPAWTNEQLVDWLALPPTNVADPNPEPRTPDEIEKPIFRDDDAERRLLAEFEQFEREYHAAQAKRKR